MTLEFVGTTLPMRNDMGRPPASLTKQTGFSQPDLAQAGTGVMTTHQPALG